MNQSESENTAAFSKFKTEYRPVIQRLEEAVINQNVTPELINELFMMLSRIRETLPFVTSDPSLTEKYRQIYEGILQIIASSMNGRGQSDDVKYHPSHPLGPWRSW